MRKITLFIAGISLILNTQAQTNYQRSSLSMILIQGTNYQEDKSKIEADEIVIDNSPQAIKHLWDNYPFPDKYNAHSIENKTFNIVSNLSTKDIIEARKNKNQKQDAQALQTTIDKRLQELRIAHQVVKNWFSSEDGTFWNMGTIQQRGLYNATDIDVNVAKSDARGMAKLADAGENLINNSFVTVTDLLVYANAPVADMYREIANGLMDEANRMRTATKGQQIAKMAVITTATGFFTAAEAIKDGYTILSKTYLYKLKWNDEIQAEFYNNWGNDAAFEKMEFELEFVGHQINETVINRGVFNNAQNRKPEVVIREAVVRNIDEAFAKLQRENDVFKPMVPVLSTEPTIIAPIGLKESITQASKFAVLQKTEDPITGETQWVKKGVVKPLKIWDNRYYADANNQKTDENEMPQGTTFKGRGVTPGMMLKLIK